MLKAELEKRYEQLKESNKGFQEKIVEGLKKIIDDYCDEALDPIHEFCDEVGIDFPMITKTYEIPYGVEVTSMYDDNGNEVEFIEQ